MTSTGFGATTDVDPLLTDTAQRLLSSGGGAPAPADAERDAWSEPMWRGLTESGLVGVGIAESDGGSGGTALDAAELVRLSGYCAAPVPLAETSFIAAPAVVTAGLALPDGPLAVAPTTGELSAEPTGSRWAVSGTAHAVAWARAAGHVVAIADGGPHGPVLVVVPVDAVQVTPGHNLAGEPRDTVLIDDAEVSGAPVTAEFVEQRWRRRGAVARSLQIAGALERVLDLTVGYAKERVQFGRPIVKFQAVSHLVAQLGEAVAQARMAAEAGALSLGVHDAEISKIIAGEAASRGAAIAHQVFGALGTTRECDLHLYTTRLWSWRDEFGGERSWADALGAEAGRAGTVALWDLISATGTANTHAG
ncbi:acyl-CoA dehydrogenase family protein [Streptomyces sp. NPDC102360]|uniref:acyl-CoA dehydrogenase family protein n=1 Tax=Streptomyces sp. NPDC102360 TaxID=3366160 RepID=UPI0037F7114C